MYDFLARQLSQSAIQSIVIIKEKGLLHYQTSYVNLADLDFCQGKGCICSIFRKSLIILLRVYFLILCANSYRELALGQFPAFYLKCYYQNIAYFLGLFKQLFLADVQKHLKNIEANYYAKLEINQHLTLMFKNNCHIKNSRSLQYSFKKQSKQNSPDKQNRPIPVQKCKLIDFNENLVTDKKNNKQISIKNLESLIKQHIMIDKQNLKLMLSNQQNILRVERKVDSVLSILSCMENSQSNRMVSQFKGSNRKNSSAKSSNSQSRMLRTSNKRNSSKSNKAILNSIQQRKREIQEELSRRISQHSKSMKQQKKSIQSFLTNIR